VQILSYDEAAKRAGIVRRTLERAISEGTGPAIVHITSRRRGVLEDDLEAWLTSRRQPQPMPSKTLNCGPGRPRKVAQAIPTNV